MRRFFAAVYKDMRLTLSGLGLFVLLLPLILLPALKVGMADLTGRSLLQAFPIAIRDEDGTVMSRSLITQLRDIDLFSEVRPLENGETDEEAIRDGAAAVATIPRDFFYDLYTMDDCPVKVTLSSAMELESRVFETMFKSIMGIIRANHATALGTYAFVYGELTPELAREMYAQSGEQLVLDALGRQGVFEETDGGTEAAGALVRRVAASVVSTLAMFFALSAAVSLPEELRLGTLPRMRAAGSGVLPFMLSKLLTAFILTIPAAAASAVFAGISLRGLIFADAVLVFGAFGVMTAAAVWSSTAHRARVVGNIIIPVSLALGGTLWPQVSLPAPLRFLGRHTAPYYASLAIESEAAGLGIRDMAAFLLPFILMGAAGLCLAMTRVSRGVRGGGGRKTPEGCDGAEPHAPRRAARLLRLSLEKLRIYTGGYVLLAVMLVAALLCGAAASAAGRGDATALRFGVCDLDGSGASAELAETLGGLEGVETVSVTAAEGRRALLGGGLEGMLTIGEGYGAALLNGERTPLRWESSPQSVSAGGAREIVAGAVIYAERQAGAAGVAESLLGRALTQSEREELRRSISDAEGLLPPLYEIGREDGREGTALFVPEPLGFAQLFALMTLLTAAARGADGESRSIRRRMGTLKNGRGLSLASDALALMLLGFSVMLAAMLPSGDVLRALPAMLSAAFAFAALALAVCGTRGTEGRIEALAPFAALAVCLVGGCFIDLADISAGVRAATLISPAGLALSAARGGIFPTAALLLEGAALLAAARRGLEK